MADSQKKEPTEAEKTNRKAWRDLLVTSVGSAAFLAAAMSNIIKTHNKHGWPKNAFQKTDYVLMTVPFLVLALSLHEVVNGDKDGDLIE